MARLLRVTRLDPRFDVSRPSRLCRRVRDSRAGCCKGGMVMRDETLATHQADEADVRALVRQLEDSWNANDGHGYASAFTVDCDYIVFDGTYLKGRLANADHHDALFRSVLRDTRLAFENVTVRFVAPTVAIMHGYGSVMMPWQATVVSRRRSVQTYVVVREDDAWRITAFQNSRVRPLAVPRGWALRLLLLFIRLRTAVATPPTTRTSTPGVRVSGCLESS